MLGFAAGKMEERGHFVTGVQALNTVNDKSDKLISKISKI